MSLSFTITPSGTAAINFLGLSTAVGRYAIDFDAGAPHQQQFRFHLPGVAGQWLIRDSAVARAITVVVRYVGDTKDAAESDYQADALLLATKQAEIVCNGQTYKGCNVRPDSIRRSSPIKPIGRVPAKPGRVWFNVSMTFTQDNPEGL